MAAQPAAVESERRSCNRLLIELCCGPDSKLGSKPRCSDGCFVDRVTIREDFTTKRGLRFVRRGLRQHYGSNILIWIAFPCTGGSSWQRINLSRGKPETLQKVQQHWDLFRRLWRNLESIEAEIRSCGARLAIEWPRACSYWNLGYVQQFCRRNALHTTLRISTGARTGLSPITVVLLVAQSRNLGGSTPTWPSSKAIWGNAVLARWTMQSAPEKTPERRKDTRRRLSKLSTLPSVNMLPSLLNGTQRPVTDVTSWIRGGHKKAEIDLSY